MNNSNINSIKLFVSFVSQIIVNITEILNDWWSIRLVRVYFIYVSTLVAEYACVLDVYRVVVPVYYLRFQWFLLD